MNFLIEITGDDATKFKVSDDEIREWIRINMQRCVKAWTDGPVPMVTVNHCNHPVFSESETLQLLRDIVTGDPDSVEDDRKMTRAIARAQSFLGGTAPKRKKP